MSCRRSPFIVCLTASLAAAPLGAVSGCIPPGEIFAAIQSIRVEIVNDTSFPVDPNIRYDDDAGFFAGLFPAQTLDTGLVAPGAIVAYTFDCDELGLIFSDEAEQIVPLIGDYILDATDLIERDDEFECGDQIRFRFVGDGLDLGVVISVNGRVVG